MVRKPSLIALVVIMALLGTTLIIAACSVPKNTGPSPAAIAAGKQLYEANCLSCHGADGAGGKKIGNSTSADVRWSALGPMYGNDTGLVSRSIIDGKNEDDEPLDAEMPLWKGKLSEIQVDNIIAYLQTLR